tara:strand:+ start:701 stop:1300 length:600 start_codon:yes stop_codon:yes gene_type:complete
MSDLDTPPSMNELMIKYFVPPVTTMYMQWGETIMVIIFFLVMFVGLGYWYVYSNYSEYQNRIAVISNAYLFGKDPQMEFERYITNAQNNSLGAAVNNIQSATSEIVDESSRLNMTASRLANTVATDLPQSATETSNLGISILSNIAKLRDTISKLGGSFVLSNYIHDGAISTVKSPEQSSQSPSPVKAPANAPNSSSSS